MKVIVISPNKAMVIMGGLLYFINGSITHIVEYDNVRISCKL